MRLSFNKFLFSSLLFLALGLVSCQGSSQATPVNPVQDTSTPQRPAGVASGDLDLLTPEQGLADLQSYHQKFELTLMGLKQGASYETSQTIDRTVINQDELVQVSQNGADGVTLQFAEAYLSGYHYTQDDSGSSCRAEAVQGSDLPNDNPAARLPVVYGLKEAGHETVNGLDTTHYIFDERSLVDSEGVLKKASGEIWWADELNAIVKFQLTAEITTSDFNGTRSWSYELDQVNGIQSLALPAACQPVLADLPILPAANNLLTLPGFLRYDTSATHAEAVTFYNQQLPALGWQPLPGSTPETADLTSPVTVLSYAQEVQAGGRILVIRLDESQGSLQVVAQTVLTKQPIRVDASSQSSGLSNQDLQATESMPGEVNLPVDLPAYPNAAILMQSQSILVFETQDSTADVIDFYLRELENSGWKKEQQYDNAGLTTLTFSRAEDTLLINLISSNTGVSQITIAAMPG